MVITIRGKGVNNMPFYDLPIRFALNDLKSRYPYYLCIYTVQYDVSRSVIVITYARVFEETFEAWYDVNDDLTCSFVTICSHSGEQDPDAREY